MAVDDRVADAAGGIPSTTVPTNGQAVWPILPAAGITAALLSWLLGGLGYRSAFLRPW